MIGPGDGGGDGGDAVLQGGGVVGADSNRVGTASVQQQVVALPHRRAR